MKAQIDSEVRRVLSESYEETRRILTSRRKDLDTLAKALVQYETLSRAEVDKVLRGEKLDKTSAPEVDMPVGMGPGTPVVGDQTTPEADEGPETQAPPGGIVVGPR